MSPPTPTVAFKKGPRRPVASRKRSTSPALDSDAAAAAAGPSTSIVRPTKKSLVNPLIQGTKRRRDAETDDTSTGGLDELDYRADESLLSKTDTYATRSGDWDLESAPPVEKRQAVRLNEDGDIDDGIYRGLNGYLPTINKTREQTDSKMKTAPIRATANIRTITLVDYQPDVCKDYKETGFCGYGDSCKFMHDRGDYLAGWQLDKLDMSEGAKGPVEEEEEEVPFACLICRKPFTEPVVTKCGHYFCMNCAVSRFIKSPKCYACGAATNGTFSKAEKILAKMEAKNQRKREARGEEDGEENGNGGIQFGGDSDEEGEGQEGGEEQGEAEGSGEED